MSLPQVFALDSEADRYPDGRMRTRLIQICEPTASGPEDVRVIHGWDAFDELLDELEVSPGRRHIDCHVWNLDYEFSHLWREVLADRYEYTEWRYPEKGQWTAIADAKAVYKVVIRSFEGGTLRITDDMRRFGNISMAKAAESVRKQHPDWFPSEAVKLESDYHDGWLDPEDPEFEASLDYAKQDAYSQAMLLRWLRETGHASTLTAPSEGLAMAVDMTYDRGRWSEAQFIRCYPPLDREMQDIAESSLLGGFVYGEIGQHKGTFTHLDYSSSYPYEYVYGKMFHGRVTRVRPGSRYWDLYRDANVFRWFLVDFDFSLKPGMMPAISGSEAVIEGLGRQGKAHKKMREGSVKKRLFTESYLEELKRHYEITDLRIREMWVAKPRTGGFEDFIRHCYESKTHLKHEGRGGTADYLVLKLYMNGGVHGKTITKTHRRGRTYYDGETQLTDTVSEPKLSFMVGFTAMQNARERLLRHCRMLIEAGHHIMMCDTDSIVVDCSESECRKVLGNWFAAGDDMESSLGRFEVETWQGRAEFDEFRCWGLKRYLELDHGEVRKSAFAGMRIGAQRCLLTAPLDGTEFEWEQLGKRTMKYGAEIMTVTKRARAESIWADGDFGIENPGDPEVFWDYYHRIKEARKRGEL